LHCLLIYATNTDEQQLLCKNPLTASVLDRIGPHPRSTYVSGIRTAMLADVDFTAGAEATIVVSIQRLSDHQDSVLSVRSIVWTSDNVLALNVCSYLAQA
jgi:hypothetical protein